MEAEELACKPLSNESRDVSTTTSTNVRLLYSGFKFSEMEMSE